MSHSQDGSVGCIVTSDGNARVDGLCDLSVSDCPCKGLLRRAGLSQKNIALLSTQ